MRTLNSEKSVDRENHAGGGGGWELSVESWI